MTAYNVEQLLGVPRLESGTGQAEADATYQLLDSWGVREKVIGFVFDTPSTNTGCYRGCCKLLEDKLGRKVLWCACRHHVMELVLGAVGSWKGLDKSK